MIPKPVAQFREKYRLEEVPGYYSGLGHFLFTTSAGLGTIAWAVRSLDGPSAVESLIVPATFLYANAVEYFAHKNPMHRRLPGLGLVFQRHTLEHHRFYTHDAMALEEARDVRMVLFPPLLVIFFFGLFALPVGFLAGRLLSPNAGWLFTATAMAYFLNYEWLHLLYHMPEDRALARWRPVALLKAHHRAHHDPRLMSEWNFNITYPLCDWLFGTRRQGA
ncbi:MAG: sterol desaturase family protein [Elusimicrobia bacterium]|nr:sterol desaturase family protein [Elusimicrobiota bacterium]